MASYDRAYSERDKTESSSYVQEYVNHFLVGEPSPGIAYEHKLAKTFIPGITATEVSDTARRLLAHESRVILAVSPQKADLKVPTERFFVRSVRHYLDRIEDADERADVRGFFGQEGRHAAEHERYRPGRPDAILLAYLTGYPVSRYTGDPEDDRLFPVPELETQRTREAMPR